MSLAGTGHVVIGERVIATVNYSFQVQQPSIVISTQEETEQIPGLPVARGHLQVVKGANDLELATGCTLVLQDGRQVQCVLDPVNVMAGSFRIALSGWSDASQSSSSLNTG